MSDPIDVAERFRSAPSPDGSPIFTGFPQADTPPDLSPRAFVFTGAAGEYFRIWIVNLLLSIATLGIYSAWAKVRRLRYFYGHTSVDGSAFGYHASPIAILKGRLVAYAVVLVLGVLGQVAPLVVLVLYLPLLAVMPVVVVRGLRFRSHNSSYRGIRFGFDGPISEAYAVFLGLPLTIPITLGLTYPLVIKCQREFVITHSRHGRSRFHLSLAAWPVYRIYLVAAACGLVLLGVPVAMFVATAVADAVANGGNPNEPVPFNPLALVALLFFYLGIGLLAVYIRTEFENLAWRFTSIDGHRFDSRLGIGRMLTIYATNILAIALTLGLAVPWARVRLARYRAESLSLLPAGPIVAESRAGVDESATSAELSEAMDFDLGI